MIRHRALINGIEVEAVYTEQAVNGIFLPLLKKLTAMQEEKGSRLVVMLAAPPGAGKSTLLSFLTRLSREREGIHPIQTIGMDGFHRRQEYLLISGIPISKSVRKAAAGEKTGWPVYDRMLHNPVEDAIRLDGEILLLEGNYLLLDEEGWRGLREYADYTISVSADEDLLRTRLIERRMKTGVAEDAAIRFVDFSDMPNVRLCLEKSLPADLQLAIDAEGDYHRCVRGPDERITEAGI